MRKMPRHLSIGVSLCTQLHTSYLLAFCFFYKILLLRTVLQSSAIAIDFTCTCYSSIRPVFAPECVYLVVVFMSSEWNLLMTIWCSVAIILLFFVFCDVVKKCCIHVSIFSRWFGVKYMYLQMLTFVHVSCHFSAKNIGIIPHHYFHDLIVLAQPTLVFNFILISISHLSVNHQWRMYFQLLLCFN